MFSYDEFEEAKKELELFFRGYGIEIRWDEAAREDLPLMDSKSDCPERVV